MPKSSIKIKNPSNPGRQQVMSVSLGAGQSDTFKLTIQVNAPSVHAACAAFVLYGLTKGFPAAKAGTAFVALQVVIRASMSGNVDLLKKAPRLWWQWSNAMAPKTVRTRGQTIQYDWDVDTFGINNIPSFAGIELGRPESSTSFDLYDVDNGPVAVPGLQQAADDALELFTSFNAIHPLIERVQDYAYDVSAFAYKIVTAPIVSSDPLKTNYGVSYSEAPIRSWFGFCGFGGSDTTEGLRFPRFFQSAQGGACNYFGIRLHFPVVMGRKHTLTRIILRSVDVMTVIEKHTRMLQDARSKLTDAGRTQTGPPTGQLPEGYYGVYDNNSTGYTPPVNLAILHRYLNIVSVFSSLAACWAGASNGLAAVAVGTNLIDPNNNAGMTESAWVMAATQNLYPVMAKGQNLISIPYPSISEEFVPYFRNAFPDAYAITGNYGGDQLDLLNSNVAGSPIILTSGPTLFDDRQALSAIDAQYMQMNPQVSSLPVMSVIRVGNPVKSRLIQRFRLDADSSNQRITSLAKMYKVPPERLIQFFSKKTMKGKSANRQSPMTQNTSVVADTSAISLEESSEVDDLLIVPVTFFEGGNALEFQRLAYEDNNVRRYGEKSQPLYAIQQVNQGSQYANDPNNSIVSSVNSFSQSNPEVDQIVDGITPLIDFLPPGVRGVARAVQKVVKAIVPPIQKAVQKGRDRRDARKGKGKTN